MMASRACSYRGARTRRIRMTTAKIDNQDLEHQRDKTLVNDTGVKVTPPPAASRDERELEREDREAEEAVRKFEESLRKLPPG
jgi:hypothetical protein